MDEKLIVAFEYGLSVNSAIEHLERAHLFVSPLERTHTWYRYHSLFRQLLSQRLEVEYPEGDVRANAEGGDEPVLIQGVIDLAFVEDGAWVLVDYKSNRVAGDWDEQALLDHYAPQLRLYARALARVTGLPVREAGLYLMATGRMAWLEADRL